MPHRSVPWIALALALLASTASADVIELLSGREVRGRIVREDARRIVVEVPGGTVTIPREEVVAIRREADDAYLVAKAEEMRRNGREEAALELLLQARRGGRADLGPRIVLLRVALARRLADAAELDAARAQIAALGAEDGRSVREDVDGLSERIASQRAEARVAAEEGLLHLARRDPAKAVEHLRRARSLDRALERSLAAPLAAATADLGVVRAQAGAFAEAAALFDRATEDDPSIAPRVRSVRAACRAVIAAGLVAVGDRERAGRVLREALRQDPEAPLPHLYLGVLAQGDGDLAAAISHFQEALRGSSAFVAGADPARLREVAAGHLGPLPVPPDAFDAAPDELDDARDGLTSIVERGATRVRAADPALAARVLDAAARARADLERWLGPEAAATPVEVSVLPRLAHMHRAASQPLHALGLTRRMRGPGGAERIDVFTAADAPGLLEDVIPHEMMHALSGGGLPLWLGEGLSSLAESEGSRSTRRARYADARGRGAAPPLELIVGLPGYPESQQTLLAFYDGSLVLCAFLAERGGRAKLLEAFRGGPDAETVLREVYGFRSLDDADRALGAWIGR